MLMQTKYLKAISVSVIGIIVLIALLYFESYLSEKQTEEWRINVENGKPSDNDMAGFADGALFMIGAFIVLLLLGFTSVIWARRDILSPRDAVTVSALSGSLPFIGLLASSVYLNVFAKGIIVICLPCDLICLFLACVGGIFAYYLLFFIKRSSSDQA